MGSIKALSFLPLAVVCTGLLCLTACSAVGPHQQRLAAKPNMLFSDSVTFNYHDKLLPQTEPGSAMSGGAQSSGCTSCK